MALKRYADHKVTSRHGWVRRWMTNLILILISTIIALMLGEVALRLRSGGGKQLSGLFRGDPELGVVLTPGFEGIKKSSEFEYEVRINSHGIRDKAIVPKPPGVRRVLVLGDSFTFGTGVPLEFSYPKLMEKHLNTAQPRFEVYNAGVPSYGPFQEAYMLQRLMAPVDPDIVVLGFFVGNDFTDNYRRPTPEESRKTLRGFLWLNSSLFRFLARYAILPWRRASYNIHRQMPSDDTLALIDETFQFVLQIRQMCAENGIDFMVMIIPRYTQVYEHAWDRAVSVFRLPPDAYDLEEPNRRLRAMLRAEQIHTLDLLQPLREAGRSRLLHFEEDRHWNREGNDVVASLLAKALLDAPGREVERR